jgi:hypothetical protein
MLATVAVMLPVTTIGKAGGVVPPGFGVVRLAVMLPDSAAHPPAEALREDVMVISAPPDAVAVICPVKVVTLLAHWLGVAPVPVMAPEADTAPESKRMLLSPLVRTNWVFENAELASVVSKVPAEATMPQVGQVLFQVPV